MVGVVGPVRVAEAGGADQSAISARRPGRARRQEGVGGAQRRYAAADGRRMFATQFEDVGDRVVFLGEIANRRRLDVVSGRQFRRRRVTHRRIRRRVGSEDVVRIAQNGRCTPLSAPVADDGVATPFHLAGATVRRQTGDAVVVVLSRPAFRYNRAVIISHKN